MVHHLSRKLLLVRVPVQWKWQTPADSNSMSWLHAVEHVWFGETQNYVYPGRS